MRKDFFYFNLPYGMERNSEGAWFVFNRDYLPLGYNNSEFKLKLEDKNGKKFFEHLPVYTAYKGLTDANLLKRLPKGTQVTYDEQQKIKKVWFYNSSPELLMRDKAKLNEYFDFLKYISTYEMKPSKKSYV